MMSDYEKYLDYINNFLTVFAFAEYYGMTKNEALALISKERKRG